MIAFDTETTGLSPLTDEIVTASMVREDNGIITTEWLLKTSINSSPEAFSKHGVSYDLAQSEGEDYLTSIEDIAIRLLGADYVVTANGVFDMTMLQASLDRYSEKNWDLSGVKMIDVMVLDKFLDKYRKGSRKLENLKDHYGVKFDGDMHDATTDSVITFFILHKQLPLLKKLGYSLSDLPRRCAIEYDKQKRSLANYFESINKKATIGLGYPITTEEVQIG